MRRWIGTTPPSSAATSPNRSPLATDPDHAPRRNAARGLARARIFSNSFALTAPRPFVMTTPNTTEAKADHLPVVEDFLRYLLDERHFSPYTSRCYGVDLRQYVDHLTEEHHIRAT